MQHRGALYLLVFLGDGAEHLIQRLQGHLAIFHLQLDGGIGYLIFIAAAPLRDGDIGLREAGDKGLIKAVFNPDEIQYDRYAINKKEHVRYLWIEWLLLTAACYG
ncbi:hypothetical protein D3C85_1357930 [compost metagenome]